MGDSSKAKIVIDGSASRAAGIVVATIAVIVFGGIGVGAFLLPTDAGLFRWIAGGVCFALAGASLPWQVLDTASRRHTLTDTSLIYRTGIIGRFEIEVPYSKIESVTVRQGPIQRLLGCGDVRVSAPGAGGPLAVSQADYSSVCMRSIPDFEKVAGTLRTRLRGIESSRTPRGAQSEDMA